MPERPFDLGDVLEHFFGVGHPLTHVSARIRQENCVQYSVTGVDWINEDDLERFGVPAAFYRFRRILQGNMVITMEDREGTYQPPARDPNLPEIPKLDIFID